MLHADSCCHDDESKSAIVHVSQVFLAEISPVQYKSNVPIAVSFYSLHHKLKPGNVVNDAGILLVHKRLAIA